MSSQRVVGSSHSVCINGVKYTSCLVDSPVCFSADLPRIYGSRWTRRNINRLNEDEQFMVECEKRQRDTQSLRHQAKTQQKKLSDGGESRHDSAVARPKETNSQKVVSHSMGHSQGAQLTTPKHNTWRRKSYCRVELPELRETFRLNRKPVSLKLKGIFKSKSSIEQSESLPLMMKTQCDINPEERQMRSTVFSRLAKRFKTQADQRADEQSQNRRVFPVPKKSNVAEILQNYIPMDVGFDMKEVINSKAFSIMETDHTMYLGEVADNKPHGNGVLFRQKSIFQGVFHQGHKKKGVERYIDGVYRGDYRGGKREGLGTFQWNNGEFYEGFWKNGLKHGEGHWHDNKGSYYGGGWKDGQQTGKGRFQHKGNLYIGNFVNFLKEGEGQEWFINGDHYKGEYHEGKPHGLGQYTWKNGHRVTGTFIGGLHAEFKTVEPVGEAPRPPAQPPQRSRLVHARQLCK